ncbi:cysteine dioxygenase family protein [Nonomuraea gerenzanensis]|uniref:Cysteine dioxygenase type I n=1 Tax=Nonomuraea gerenzanensis TaxID=93944 RepID=A0A1M4E141_9ACTN|nr:cysteine dioxygenase family protein [Nonomuraea gerenzanensis]UBU14812.1 cysteine dioxygenase family protein [Nonomuraea gerenzanensis]SBO92540.1 cysteine dioxygenase type I [Nonomuraea gerenzanensis]
MNMAAATTVTRPGLAPIVSGVSRIVAHRLDGHRTAHAVAALLRERLPGLDLLTPQERAGSPERYVSHILHAEERFSVVGVVWRPGQDTVIHDHVSWCTFGILSGIEDETLYRDMGDHLVEIGRAENRPGEVSGFAPPGDIHKVRNTSSETGVSLHVYGADVRRLGSSVRRTYDLPVR